jgi:lipoate-protein ligase A
MGCVLQHGTVLLDLDLDLMFELLKVPPEKMKGKVIREVKERVTSLRAVLGREVSFEEAVPVFAEGFRRALSLEFVRPPEPEGPATAEEDRARSLALEKFSSPQWLYKR